MNTQYITYSYAFIIAGVFTQDLSMFGNSWAEEEPQLARCPVVPSLYSSACATQDPHVLLVPHTHTHIYLQV